MTRNLFKSIDPAILLYFRFFAGILLACELINSSSLEDLREYSQWFSHWSNVAVLLHYGVTILAALSVAVGFKQKLSSKILFLGYSLLYLLERSGLASHLYLYCLVSFWLIWMPVPVKGKMESPAWYYLMMIFNIVVYFVSNGFQGSWYFTTSTFPWFCLMTTSLLFGTSWPRRFTWIDFLYPDALKTGPHSKWLLPVLGVYCAVLLCPAKGEISWLPEFKSPGSGAIYYVVDERTRATKMVLPREFSIPGKELVMGRFSLNRD